MDGLLTEVVTSTQGSAATADVALGETEVPVENLSDFASDGGRVDIAGVVYDYTGVDASTVDAEGVGGSILLDSPLTADVDEFDPVLLLVGDEPAVDYYAVIDLVDDQSGEPVWVPLETREERLAWTVRTYDPPLPVTVAEDLSRILRAPGVVPLLDGAAIDTSTLPAIPGGQTISDDAPVEVDGYPEDYGWWQMVDGEVLGFWRLVGGAWAQQAVAPVLVGETINGVTITGSDITGTNTITGPLIRTSATGNRIEVTNADEIRFYSGDANEITSGQLISRVSGAGQGITDLRGPSFASDPGLASIELRSAGTAPATAPMEIHAFGDRFTAQAEVIRFLKGDGSQAVVYSATTGTFSLLGGTAFGSGSVGTGTFRDSVRAALVGDYAAGSWATDWTPTWGGATSNPAIGNGTLVGRYICLGKTVHFYIEMTAGSTTTFGTGLWTFDLPVAEVARRFTVAGHALDTSSNDQYPIVAIRAASDTLNIRCDPTTAGGAMRGVAVGQPFAWANGDILHISGTYEAA